jgi:hypothetical protein
MKKSTENKIINFSKFLTVLAIPCIIYLGFSILAGLNTLNAIQNDQRAIVSELRDSNNAIACDQLNEGDNLAYYKCMYNPQ